MAQQRPYHSNDNSFKRKLFYDNGLRFIEVKGRMTGDYKPPAPVLKASVNETLQSSSGLVQRGTAHYTTSIGLLFSSKHEYAEWLQYIGSTHKYYDEKGTIYIGVVSGQPVVDSVEVESKYLVNVSLVLVRKQDFEFRHQDSFVDVDGHWAEKQITEMQQRGLIAVYSGNGEPVQYFMPDDYGTRAHGVSFMTRTFKYIDKLLRGY